MNLKVRFSEVPVGKQFEYNGQTYTRYTFFRGKQTIDGKTVLTRFPKHRLVTAINAWSNIIEG